MRLACQIAVIAFGLALVVAIPILLLNDWWGPALLCLMILVGTGCGFIE